MAPWREVRRGSGAWIGWWSDEGLVKMPRRVLKRYCCMHTVALTQVEQLWILNSPGDGARTGLREKS